MMMIKLYKENRMFKSLKILKNSKKMTKDKIKKDKES